MAKYIVSEICEVTYGYRVEAESEEEAEEKVSYGSDDIEYLGEIDSIVTNYEVEEEEE